jgi:hypothetical protein
MLPPVGPPATPFPADSRAGPPSPGTPGPSSAAPAGSSTVCLASGTGRAGHDPSAAPTCTRQHVCGDDLAPALDLLDTTSLAEELVEGVHPLEAIGEQLDLPAAGRVDGEILLDPTEA